MSRDNAARRLLVALLMSALWVGIGATSASALARQVGCAELQSAIDEVAQEHNHGEGDIVLNGLCDAANLGSSNGVTLPAGANLALEGKQETDSGFDGSGVVDGPLLGTIGSEEAGAITLSDLTFQRANLNGASALAIRASRVTLVHDSFLENDEHGEDSHAAFVSVGQSPAACPPTGTAAIALLDSTFSGNTLALGSSQGGGAGAWLQDACEPSRDVLEGDAFEGNVLEANGTPQGTRVTGAGLLFVGGAASPVTVSQSGNVFDSNTIVAPSPDVGDYAGGGEWLEGASLLSVDDRFSRNTIAGTSSNSYESWSWGAGLAISNLSFACSQPAFPESALEDAVVEGNAIGPGMEADLGGGGVWVGCTHLRVSDSTVTLNSAPNGSGIEGEPGDRLELANSIVAQDSPGDELAGFAGEPSSSLSASFSDVCSAAKAPLPGAGNICADPLLADDGDGSSFDVHETESSPTIDAGSNALVPTGLTSDFYGNQRILSGRVNYPSCTPPESVTATLDPAVVDMGASEYGPIALPAIAIPCKEMPNPQAPTSPQVPEQAGASPPGPAGVSSGFTLPSLVQHADGELALTFKGLSVGSLRVRASFELANSVVTTRKGRRRRVHKLATLTYGQATMTIGSRGDRTLYLKPTREALGRLVHSGRLAVGLSITLSVAGATPTTRYKTITVVYRAARPTAKAR